MSFLVSIIMPAYNAEKLISDSINSVLSQTYKNFELIVIDDCSQDQTSQVVENFILKDKRVKLIKNIKNKGVAETRNTGLDQAKGDYVAFLDSDDKWDNNKLEKQLAVLKERNDVDVVYGSYYRFNNDGIKNIVKVPNLLDKKELLKGNPIGNLTAIYNFKKYSQIRQKNIGHEDYLFWLEIFNSSPDVKGIGIQEPIAYYRVAEDAKNLSGNKLKAASWTWTIYRKHLKLNLISSLFYFSYYMIKAILKRV
ncbi:glycosyltransferase family 2 protein [Acinetobacter sp. TWP2-2-3]|jgi:teichuronic acid biosynthesis glycosyltransferase TuaG|uniref:glycosyltransferase family 2 protein n=1 Tax=unclassified Acinetobacter TaxID=196816 RepID=UPI003CED0A3A